METFVRSLPLLGRQMTTLVQRPPLAVNTNCTYTSETNLGATASAGAPASGCASYSGGDVWFTITVLAGGYVTVETNDNGGISDGGMAIYSGICSSLTLIECDDDDGAGAMKSITLIGPNSWNYIMGSSMGIWKRQQWYI